MATEKNKEAAEAEIKEVAEDTVEAVESEAVDAAEEAVDAVQDEVNEAAAEDSATAAPEEDTAAEEEAEVTEEDEVSEAADAAEPAAEEAAAEEEAAEEAPRKVSSKRIKKTERREAKAARKAANKIEEKKSRPNNALIAILIFGVVVGMFAFVLGYNYFSKPANIAKYIEANGGEESFGSIAIDEYTNAAITADKNSMKIALTATVDDKDTEKIIRDYYSGDSGKEQLESLAAYFLTGIKPQTRAFSADATITVTVNGEEVNKAELTYKEAKELMEADDEKEDMDTDTEEGDSENADADDSGDDAAESEENED